MNIYIDPNTPIIEIVEALAMGGFRLRHRDGQLWIEREDEPSEAQLEAMRTAPCARSVAELNGQ